MNNIIGILALMIIIIFSIISYEVWKSLILDFVKVKLCNHITKKVKLDKSVKTISGMNIKTEKCYFNSRCHWVALTEHLNNNNLEVIPCITTNKNNNNGVAVHFINYDPQQEVYIDNCYGALKNQLDYHLLNKVDAKSNSNMNWHINVAKKGFYNAYVKKFSWLRIFTSWGSI